MVNFVKHIRAIMYKLEADSRIEAYHVSLYWALFQTWNEHRFQNPMRIYRDEVMARAKIHTRTAYAKCMRELSEWDYFSYDPAIRRFEPGIVALRRFDGVKNTYTPASMYPNEMDVSETRTETERRTPEDSISETALRTSSGTASATDHDTHNINSRNNTNIQNNLNENEQAHPISDFGNDFTHSVQTPDAEEKSYTRGGGAGGDRPEAIPASLDDVYLFFTERYSTRVEAEKFYHYYAAKGWKISEKLRLHNWRSAAQHWILNAPRFNPHNGPTPGSLASPGPQNYSEPL